VLYLDATALVKRYVPETGRQWLDARLRSERALYTSSISYAETHAALARRFREGDLKRKDFLEARNRFEVDWLQLQEIAVDNETLAPIARIVESVPLRGMDAIHLAAAIWLHRKFQRETLVVASDSRLLKGAQQFGFTVLDPASEESKSGQR
jgi:predicted nucleic acid-binding protein